jgi:hypothetical protein
MSERVSNEKLQQIADGELAGFISTATLARIALDARRERDEERMRVGVLREAIDRQVEAAQDDAIEHNRTVCQLAAANKAVLDLADNETVSPETVRLVGVLRAARAAEGDEA